MSGIKRKISMKRVSVLIMIALILLIVANAALVLYACHSLLDNYRQTSGQSVLQVWGHTLDNRLRIVTNYMNSVIVSGDNARMLSLAQDARSRFTARRGVSALLSTLLQLEPLADGALCWTDGDQVAIHGANDMETNESIKREILRLAAEENSRIVNCGWRWTNMGGVWYLVNITKAQSVSCAVWMRESTLAALHSGAGDYGNYQLYFRQDQEAIGLGGEPMERLPLDHALAVEPSGEGNFFYCCVARGEMGAVSRMIWWVGVLGLLIATAVCVLLSMFYHRVHQMLREIQAGLVIRSEDLSHALPEPLIKETDSVYQTLNDMSHKIQTLQAHLYQHELNEQKSRLQALHMQINSHFFRNCMNIIFSLAEVKNTPLIQDFCIYLIDYLNYINTAFRPSSPLREELVHLENYLTLQQMRYPGRVEWRIDADEEAKEFPILPLLLLTFVENVFKHGMIEGEVCVVQIQAACQERGGQRGLFIRIEDNGSGISEEKAAALNAFDFSLASDIDFSNQKSGIEKTLARIQLFYGENATFHIGRNSRNRRTVIQLFFPQGKI